MADLTPRTRSESFLNGEDLEPITRREHFYSGRENELPEGHQEPETREEWFIQKYREAGDVTVESLSITENGTYTAPSGKAYSPVSVNVPLPSNAYLLQTIEHESIATFSDGTDNFLKSLEVAIEPQQEGSGEPSPTNIRPISGWTEANVTVADLNTMSVVDNWLTTINVAHSISKDTITIDYLNLVSYNNPCVLFDDDRTVTLSVELITGVATGVKIQLLDKNNTQVGQINNTSKTFTGIGSKIRLDYGGGGKAIIKGLKIYGNGQTITIQLGDTYYGGKLDVVSGVLTVTDGFISSYNSETLPSTWISDRDVYAEGTTPTIGAEVCYKLATPQTIQLPPTIIKSLQGENNLFASTGEIERMQYWGR